MAKDVTLADIAEQVGVSKVAVSKALAGKPGVSEELREKIQKLADELGYVSNTSKKKMKMKMKAETGNIGVVVPENYYGLSISFYGQMYEKVVRALYDNGYFGIMELLSREDELSGKLPRVMEDGRVDGLILLGALDDYYIARMLQQTKVPVYFLDTYTPGASYDTVISGGYYGTYMLTDYLIRQGHRRIGFVGSVDATSSIADRFWGYRRALRENKICFEPDWEIPDLDENGISFEQISGFPERMDAYVCNSDFTAARVIRELRALGISVPEEVSVTGFDDFQPYGMEEEGITTYRVDMERMAEVCVKSLIRKIKQKKYIPGIQIVSGSLVLRDSAAPYRQSPEEKTGLSGGQGRREASIV